MGLFCVRVLHFIHTVVCVASLGVLAQCFVGMSDVCSLLVKMLQVRWPYEDTSDAVAGCILQVDNPSDFRYCHANLSVSLAN